MMTKPQSPTLAYSDDNTMYVSSDKYFNDSSHRLRQLEDMGVSLEPVDIFGGFVPQNKSLGNLKKNEQAIRERFNLGK